VKNKKGGRSWRFELLFIFLSFLGAFFNFSSIFNFNSISLLIQYKNWQNIFLHPQHSPFIFIASLLYFEFDFNFYLIFGSVLQIVNGSLPSGSLLEWRSICFSFLDFDLLNLSYSKIFIFFFPSAANILAL